MRPKAKATAAKANGAGQGGSYVGARRDSVTGAGRTARWGQAARAEQKGAGGWREGLPWLALLPVLRCSMAHGAPPENLNTPGHTAGDKLARPWAHWPGGGVQGRRRRRLGLFRSSFGPWPLFFCCVAYFFLLPGAPAPLHCSGQTKHETLGKNIASAHVARGSRSKTAQK